MPSFLLLPSASLSTSSLSCLFLLSLVSCLLSLVSCLLSLVLSLSRLLTLPTSFHPIEKLRMTHSSKLYTKLTKTSFARQNVSTSRQFFLL
ncbi:hypothetical protein ACN38_g6223 [Penicillium nordicum]|uniref:Uncharacterized protein n=1 Tax=Penicillium nordicum TaxID=229535 RepID=A0A0M8P7H1_9EURO|nr:hypothetical protein ACN38_g6223 [Penicillium nordicum]